MIDGIRRRLNYSHVARSAMQVDPSFRCYKKPVTSAMNAVGLSSIGR